MTKYENDTKLFNSISNCSIKCKNCGHTKIITKVDRTICNWCGKWIYKNDKFEFKYNLEKLMRCESGK